MARRKSIKKVAQDFRYNVDAVKAFTSAARASFSAQHISYAYEYAIIRLYRDFEDLILNALKGAINNNTDTLSNTVNIEFPKSLSDAVCEYIITGGGYFDFKGRDGLIKTLKSYVPADHYIVAIVKKSKYKNAIEQLSALRNFAAHDSEVSRSRAKGVVSQNRIGSAGSWLKSQERLETIAERLKELAREIEAEAPY
jgi:hypothetical protein